MQMNSSGEYGTEQIKQKQKKKQKGLEFKEAKCDLGKVKAAVHDLASF